MMKSILSKQRQSGTKTVCLYLENGNPGVHGIVASRVKDLYCSPTILFSPKYKDKNLVVGSGRSIKNVNIKNVLDIIQKENPNIMIQYGGHIGAAGITLKKAKFDEFSILFEKIVTQELSKHNPDIRPSLYIDGSLDFSKPVCNWIEKIGSLEPFGYEFEAPTFLNKGVILSLNFFGDDLQHAEIYLNMESSLSVKGIWFFCVDKEFQPGDSVKVIYSLPTGLREELVIQIRGIIRV